MVHLPTEIIVIVFQYLPQKYISIGSTICKQWHHILSQPHFYKTIHIYSISQIQKCIQIANIKTKDNQAFSQYVENIYFHTNRKICYDIIINILNTFPNLHCIQGVIPQRIEEEDEDDSEDSELNTSRSRGVMISPQHQLEHLFYWYQNFKEQWMNTFEKQYDKTKSLEFSTREDLLVLHERGNQSLKKPIIHFTTNRDIIGEYIPTDRFDISFYYPIALKLPMMSCLNNLTIEFTGINGSDELAGVYCGNEQLFETIHQSCPQLKSLTLILFEMFISENGKNHLTNQSFQPNVSLKELSIYYGINHPTCYDYLSFKYPHLESLTLTLSGKNYLKSSREIFKLAIYKMITQYSYLKKLQIRHNNIISYKFWPLVELLEWLQQNPAQLHCLDYHMNFSVEKLDTKIDNGNITPLKVKFQYLPILQHDYLNHLSSLSLGGDMTFSCMYALFYFYLCNHHENGKNFISNSIETLVLKADHSCFIYFWLYAFPNLKSLSITGNNYRSKVVDYVEIDNNTNYSKEILGYLEKKMKQQEQSWIHTLSSSSSMEVEAQSHFFKLKKLEIKNCKVHFEKYKWDGFMKKLPYLKTVILSNVNRVGIIHSLRERNRVNPPPQDVFFDWSHLSLDLLQIRNFNDQSNYLLPPPEIHHCVKELMINETSLKKTYYVGPDNLVSDTSSHQNHSTTLHIKCNYIVYIDFHDNLM